MTKDMQRLSLPSQITRVSTRRAGGSYGPLVKSAASISKGMPCAVRWRASAVSAEEWLLITTSPVREL